jgi:D-threo-aldose 1-dehydrogenase
MSEGYRAIRSLREQALVRAIGLGVNEWQVCEEVLQLRISTFVLLAGRYTLLEQEGAGVLSCLCASAAVSRWSSVGRTTRAFSRAMNKRRQRPITTTAARPADIMARVDSIQAVCARHRVPMAAAALQFPLAHPAVISVIPGMSSAAEVGCCGTLDVDPDSHGVLA